MKTAVVGGGIVGLTLSLRLAELGHQVELLEASSALGGLCRSADYGPFVWDRFYHCILPQDTRLVNLLGDLGLRADLRWVRTQTGYYARGQCFPMTTLADSLRFPLLSLPEKLRLGAAMLYAARIARPQRLHNITAKHWLTRLCGKRTYETFWEPLLRAKLGPYHDKVAAVFLWATMRRLTGARTGATKRENLGYVAGGYGRVLKRFEEILAHKGIVIRTNAAVRSIARVPDPSGRPPRCELLVSMRGAQGQRALYDQVFYTAPPSSAKTLLSDDLQPVLESAENAYPNAQRYLGLACLVLVLKKPLTPFYVLNIGDTNVGMTGVIEMTNLIDRAQETAGHALVYIPQYVDSQDPMLDEPDAVLYKRLMDFGVKQIFKDLAQQDILAWFIHRAKQVQPLPLATQTSPHPAAMRPIDRPLQFVGTFMLRCATLNNNEAVGLVEDFVKQLQPSP